MLPIAEIIIGESFLLVQYLLFLYTVFLLRSLYCFSFDSLLVYFKIIISELLLYLKRGVCSNTPTGAACTIADAIVVH